MAHSKQLYHHCFYRGEVLEDDLFPVGGGFIGSTKMPWKVRTDFGSFFPKFENVAQRHRDWYQSESWQEWFLRIAPDADPTLLTTLQLFTATFEAKRRLQSTEPSVRCALYDGAPDHTVNLSDIFSSNLAMCVEISLLAKRYLDTQGISSCVYSGEMLPEFTPGDIHIPRAHTFLVIENAGKEYVYDPANPNGSADGRDLFALLRPCRSLLHGGDLRNNVLLIQAEDIITKRALYYGVGDCGNVPEKYILHKPAAPRPGANKPQTSTKFLPK